MRISIAPEPARGRGIGVIQAMIKDSRATLWPRMLCCSRGFFTITSSDHAEQQLLDLDIDTDHLQIIEWSDEDDNGCRKTNGRTP